MCLFWERASIGRIQRNKHTDSGDPVPSSLKGQIRAGGKKLKTSFCILYMHKVGTGTRLNTHEAKDERGHVSQSASTPAVMNTHTHTYAQKTSCFARYFGFSELSLVFAE